MLPTRWAIPLGIFARQVNAVGTTTGGLHNPRLSPSNIQVSILAPPRDGVEGVAVACDVGLTVGVCLCPYRRLDIGLNLGGCLAADPPEVRSQLEGRAILRKDGQPRIAFRLALGFL